VPVATKPKILGMPPDLTLRDAHPEELDEAAAVMVAAYEEYAPFLSPESWEYLRHDVADVRGRLSHAELVVAELTGRIVGAVTFYPDGTSYVLPTQTPWPKEWAAIRLLTVHPEVRGLGIGRELTLECLRRARRHGATSIGLHTNPGMAVARGMYERMGFQRSSSSTSSPCPESSWWLTGSSSLGCLRPPMTHRSLRGSR
jgi:ribosomal protein S18 acetylase RimI-like enzyme